MAEAGIGGQCDGRDGGSLGELEGRVDAVLRGLTHVLDERELRYGEGRGDAGLVKEDDAEAGADDGLGIERVGEAETRPEVVVVSFARGFRVAVHADESSTSVAVLKIAPWLFFSVDGLLKVQRRPRLAVSLG